MTSWVLYRVLLVGRASLYLPGTLPYRPRRCTWPTVMLRVYMSKWDGVPKYRVPSVQ